MIRIIRYAAPETELPEDFPGEDLEFIGENPSPEDQVPSPEEIAGAPVAEPPPPKGQRGQPYYEMADFTFLPFGEDKPENVTPEDPSKLFEEVPTPETPTEEMNRRLSVREKIWRSLNTASPMSIKYQTLADDLGRTAVTNRIVRPDYVYWAGTNRHILVAWCNLRNDWRAFAVDNILAADLIGD